MKIKELLKKRWDYVLYEVDNGLILTVMFFDQIDYPRSFIFENNEVSLLPEDIESLSAEIRMNYESFKKNEVKPPILV